jgi:hypothetical protein
MIIVCIYSTFSSGIQLNVRSEKHNRIYKEANLTLRLLNEELANAVSYDFSNSYPDKRDFSGQPHQIRFLLPTETGLRVVRYYLIEADRDKVHQVVIGDTYQKNVDTQLTPTINFREERFLVREESSLVAHLNQSSQDFGEREIISKHIGPEGLRFFYSGQDPVTGDAISRKTIWQTKGMPAQVSLEIDYLSTNPKQKGMTLKRSIYIPHGSAMEQG